MQKPSTTYWHEITPKPGEKYNQNLHRELKTLMDQLNYLLVKAKEDKDIQGAINWADLQCCETYYCINNDGLSFYCADIEELSPENRALEEYLENEMYSQFGFNRELRLNFEW